MSSRCCFPVCSSTHQTIGNVAGPGVGAGVGSAGQFSTNGLRSRGNNFTVDGSDNNDEDIGVRRQGFVALIPQPAESIQEYQVITLLAPAQFGRNIEQVECRIEVRRQQDSWNGLRNVQFESANARNFLIRPLVMQLAPSARTIRTLSCKPEVRLETYLHKRR